MARQGCAKAKPVAARALHRIVKQRRCSAERRNGAVPMAESELQGLSYDENGNATALYAPLSNATAMKARISPAMELRCPASEGVANQRWLGKGNARY